MVLEGGSPALQLLMAQFVNNCAFCVFEGPLDTDTYDLQIAPSLQVPRCFQKQSAVAG